MPTIFIDIDSLRPDHVGAYGYGPATTPRIDDVAMETVRFDTAYVANSPCLPSRAALLSGRYGIDNGVVSHGPQSQQLQTPAHRIAWAGTWRDHTDERPWWTLPELFYQNRVPTLAVSSFPRHPAPWFHTVWHDVRQPQEPEGPGESFQTPRAETVVDTTIDLLDGRTRDDFFLYVQFWDPHAPYNRTDEEIDRFRDISLPTHPNADAIETHQQWDAWRAASDLGVESRDDLRELIAQYDAEIRYVDRHLGRFFTYLRQHDLFEESLIIVTADHGEEFGEHGLYREHWSTHDGTQRVPLLIKPPTSASGVPGAREQLVTNVDLAPTIADYAGFAPPSRWQGTSLKPLLEDEPTDWRDHVVFEHGLYTAQRAIRTDRWKLIHTYHPGMWSGRVEEFQLYDMESDPTEQTNVADAHPERVDALGEQMAEWVDHHLVGGTDPLKTVANDGPAGYNTFVDDYSGV